MDATAATPLPYKTSNCKQGLNLRHSEEKCFLDLLFLYLLRQRVRYAVLRNYDSLPFSLKGSDLDILVHPEDEQLAHAVIEAAISDAGGVAIGYGRTLGFFKVHILGREKSNPHRWWGVCLDIAVGLQYGGVAKLLRNSILDNGYDIYNGVRVLSKDMAAILGVIKELLHNDLLPSRYLPIAAEAVRNDWPTIRANLSPMGEPALTYLRNLCLTTTGVQDVSIDSKVFRRAVMRSAFWRAPLPYLRFRFSYHWSKVNRYFHPSGMMVALLGTDGVGKSTVISAISPVLSAATHGSFMVKHLRPGLLPPLSRLKRKQPGRAGPVTDPHSSMTSGRLGSLLRVLYLMVDYLLGYWLLVRPKIGKEPTIVLFDRYAYDLVLDPRRFRIQLPGSLLHWLTRFAPRPDLIICLHGDPGLIAARKSEVPLEEVRRQIEALLEFAKQEPRAVLISTDNTVERTRDDVLNALKSTSAHNQGCTRRVDINEE